MDKTLVKGLQVLEHVVRSGQKVRITDLANDMNLTKSNAYRLLKTLESTGFVAQDPATKDFSPSMKIWELGMLIMNRLDLRDHAREVLRRLADTSRETVHLAVLDGQSVIYIDKIDSVEPIASYTTLGGRAPAYCVATGKALLSQLPDENLKARLVSLEQHSVATLTDENILREQLAKARTSGFAINRGEWREDVWGLAAVIRDASGSPIAAVGVSGPKYRFQAKGRSEALAEMVRSAANDISAKLRGAGVIAP